MIYFVVIDCLFVILNDHGLGNDYLVFDANEAEKRANGVRIISGYLKDYGYVAKNRSRLDTLGGAVDVEYQF